MASSKYEYYKHRPLRSTAGFWFIAVASLVIGAVVFFGLSADTTNLDVARLQRLTVTISVSVSAISVIIGSAYRWFYN
jgi:hypothetical protein